MNRPDVSPRAVGLAISDGLLDFAGYTNTCPCGPRPSLVEAPVAVAAVPERVPQGYRISGPRRHRGTDSPTPWGRSWKERAAAPALPRCGQPPAPWRCGPGPAAHPPGHWRHRTTE